VGCPGEYPWSGGQYESSCGNHDCAPGACKTEDRHQGEKAEQLGITQPRLNDLLRVRIDKFSLDALVNLASLAGLRVNLWVRRAA